MVNWAKRGVENLHLPPLKGGKIKTTLADWNSGFGGVLGLLCGVDELYVDVTCPTRP